MPLATAVKQQGQKVLFDIDESKCLIINYINIVCAVSKYLSRVHLDFIVHYCCETFFPKVAFHINTI